MKFTFKNREEMKPDEKNSTNEVMQIRKQYRKKYIFLFQINSSIQFLNGHKSACTGTKISANSQRQVCVGPIFSVLVLTKTDNKNKEQQPAIITVITALPLNSFIPAVFFAPFPCSLLKQ